MTTSRRPVTASRIPAPSAPPVRSSAVSPPASAGPVFDPFGPLPQGTTVLEASAGTGKTHTIAALVTRYVAEGAADLPQVLVVTFGRAATSELRDRVRTVMLATLHALGGPDPSSSADALVRHLASSGQVETLARAARLSRALAQFDSATITTTHGFCRQMLASLGMLGDVDDDATFVPDVADLVRQVADDLYLRAYAEDAQPVVAVTKAREIIRASVGDHHAVLAPSDAPEDSAEWHRVRLAAQARDELRRRKRSGRLIDYDDLLVLLRDSLAHPEHGPVAAARLRAAFRVVLVDEFQDTDPVQWDILRQAFHGHAVLVLIGDPKQAIYAFRGADVVTYLAAKGSAGEQATLGRNWRSDEPLLRALEGVFRGAALGDDRILVHPVAAEHLQPRLQGAPPVRLRYVTRAALGYGERAKPLVDGVRSFVAPDVAADVVETLTGPLRLLEDGRWRPVQPGDIAVVTRRNEDASAVRDALAAAGVPAVQSMLASVFGTTAAQHWLTLLVALDQPWRSGRVAAAALTPFVGWDAARLGTAGDAERDELSDTIGDWARILATRGVGELLHALEVAGLARRLIGTERGERALVDIRHIGQALHEVWSAGAVGTAALAEWLRARASEAGSDYTEERSRRLETDAEAVQVVTVHASKGLQFPIVYVPFAWDRFVPSNPDPLLYHSGDTRTLHVGGPRSLGYSDALSRHVREERGEDLRLLYVALTRAQSQVVLWWAPSRTTAQAPLTRMLLGEHGYGENPPESVSTWERHRDTLARLEEVAAGSAGTVRLEVLEEVRPAARWSPPARADMPLKVATLGRGFDLQWRRTSYSRITAAAHASAPPATVGSEPERVGVLDEADLSVPTDGGTPGPTSEGRATPTASGDAGASDAPTPARHLVSPMADLPGGTAFGTLVHQVLETVDTSASDLHAELEARCRNALSARLSGLTASDLAAPLALVLDTPLGPLADDLRLRHVHPRDRLAELEFELPLAGGDTPKGRAATPAAVADLLRRHLEPSDPFAAYADRLSGAGLTQHSLRGYLTGSIDAVLRLTRGGQPRYVVVDYKTNRLGPAGAELTTWHYRREAMVEAMMLAHYPLQLLLYLVALHRFLRWRQPRYDPDRHLGGGLYLFVRGMCGPDTPRTDGDGDVSGVLGWRPPTSLVVELSALLDGTERSSLGDGTERSALGDGTERSSLDDGRTT